MNYAHLLVLVISTAIYSQEPINFEHSLIERDGVFYTKDRNRPYSGNVFSMIDMETSNQIKSEGSLVNGIPSGVWQRYYPNGTLKSKGEFKNGLLIGPYIEYNWKGEVSLQGQFEYEVYDLKLIEGRTKVHYTYPSNADIGAFNDRLVEGKTGKWIEWGNSGNRTECTYVNGEYDGQVTLYRTDGTVHVTWNYRNGILSGTESWFHGNEKLLSEGQVIKGKREGVWKYYYDTGELNREESYSGGKLDGNFTEWYQNGLYMKKGFHNTGEQRGTWTEWYEDGQKMSETEYLWGKKGSESQWYSNGNTKHINQFLEGTLIIWESWHENGSKKSLGDFDAETSNIAVTEWYSDGKLKTEGVYRVQLNQFHRFEKKKLRGTWDYYNEYGRVILRE